MIGRIIIGLIISTAGFILVWKSEWFNQNFGSIAWAEAKIGSMGGSRLMYKLIGIATLLTGFLMVTGLHRAFFGTILGFFFGTGGNPDTI